MGIGMTGRHLLAPNNPTRYKSLKQDNSESVSCLIYRIVWPGCDQSRLTKALALAKTMNETNHPPTLRKMAVNVADPIHYSLSSAMNTSRSTKKLERSSN